MYLLSAEKFEHDCAYIVACEDGLVGQAIVARNDEDGQFHLGRQLRDFTYSCLCFLNCPARSEMMVKKASANSCYIVTSVQINVRSLKFR